MNRFVSLVVVVALLLAGLAASPHWAQTSKGLPLGKELMGEMPAGNTKVIGLPNASFRPDGHVEIPVTLKTASSF